MQEANLFKQTVDNALPVAIDTTTKAGYAIAPGLDPIPLADIVAVHHDTYAAEVQQLYTLTAPTIVADTLYGLKLGALQDVSQEWQKRLISARYTSPATLSGTPLIDKQQVINNIAYAINNNHDLNKHVWAGQIAPVTVHGATVTAGGFAVNTIVTGSVTGSRMVVLSQTATSFTGIVLNGIYPTTADLVFSGTAAADGSPTTSASGAPTITAAAGTMGILDQPLYYEQGTKRKGKTTVLVSDGFLSTALVETTAAVYSFGEGAEMIKTLPLYDQHTGNIIQGNWNGAGDTGRGGEAFVSGNNYDRTIIEYVAQAPSNATTNHPARRVQQAIWYQTGDGNKAAWLVTVNALVP